MIKLKSLLMENWSAVVLNEKSKNYLIQQFKTRIPSGWDIIAHHMTIDPFKGLKDESSIGKKVELKVTDIGKGDKALAVKVKGYNGKTNNAFPHITIAINKNEGGKAKDSNNIKEWEHVTDEISLEGTIENLK